MMAIVTDSAARCPFARLSKAEKNPPNVAYPQSADAPDGAMTEPWAPEQIAQWGTDWEAHLGAMPTAAQLERAAADAREIQHNFAVAQHQSPERAMHAKGTDAGHVTFEVSSNLPDELAFGPFQPGAVLSGKARYSNGAGSDNADSVRDRRGLAFDVWDHRGRWCFLGVSGSPRFVAPDGAAAVQGLKAESLIARYPGLRGKLMGGKSLVAGLVRDHGLKGFADALSMSRAQKETVDGGKSLAANTYYSRVKYTLGDHAVMLRYVPRDTDTQVHGSGFNALREDLDGRGPITYAVQVVGYTNPRDTPMANAHDPWRKSDYLTVGKLTVTPAAPGADAQALQAELDGTHFAPWDRPADATRQELEPADNVGAFRKVVYPASQQGRGAVAPTPPDEQASVARCPFGHG